jgi:hypothetical protein
MVSTCFFQLKKRKERRSMMKKVLFLSMIVIFTLSVSAGFAADVVPPEIDMPGTQPEEVSMESPGRCLNCHKNYEGNPRVEPGFGWMGAAMGNAGRDPIFWATLAIAEQDFDGAGDLCIRCHSVGGWMAGRSTPTDGSGLAASDDNGIDCDTCHLLVNPDQGEHVGTMFDPFIANQDDLIGPLPPGTTTEGYYGSGMMVMSNDYGKLGPYNTGDAVARHQHTGSDFHRDTDFCGTCHDVSNSAVGDLAPNAGTQPGAPDVVNSYDFPPVGAPNLGGPVTEKAAFNNPPYAFGIVERTFSEYKSSPLSSTLVDDFNTLPADLQDTRGSLYNAYWAATTQGTRSANYVDGDLRYFSCQTCHMRAITGRGCDKSNAPNRLDQPMHDQTGGNYWVFPLVQYQDTKGTLRLGGGLSAEQIEAMDDGILRAKTHLTQAATLDVNGDTVRITNMTGHKVITGYPEGRRMWLNIKWYDGVNPLPIRIDGEYGPLLPEGQFLEYTDVNGQVHQFNPESILNLNDPNTKIYEVHPAITREWAQVLMSVNEAYWGPKDLGFDRLTGASVGTIAHLANGTIPGHENAAYYETFHFALNNYVAFDNRIPPYQMSYDESLRRNAQPVPANQYGGSPGGVYNHWDEFNIAQMAPAGAVGAELTLYYQGTSWEYVQFLDKAVIPITDPPTPGQVTPFLADEGRNFLDAWFNTGMVPPHVMATATWGTTQCTPEPEGEGPLPGNCNDALDNDCDGLIDCEDPDCADDPICPPALIEWPMCLDDLDNDNDGLIDCADRTDCDGFTETCGVGVCESTGSYCDNGTKVVVTCTAGTPTEDPEVTCGDGLDNDCDGLTDADDSDCQADCTAIMDRNVCRNTSGCEWVGGKNGTCQYAVPCDPTEPGMEMTCDDGADNDCDGVIDCADTDCNVAPNCQVVCTDIPTETECLAAGCSWNNKKGCR